jgi:hypothetical protein
LLGAVGRATMMQRLGSDHFSHRTRLSLLHPGRNQLERNGFNMRSS